MFTLELTGAQSITFEVRRFGLEQRIGGLYRLGVRVHTTLHDVTMAELVGSEAFIPFEQSAPMPGLGGIVGQVELISTELTGESIFELTVVPKLWLTTRSINNRIFQDVTVPQIVAEVLRGYDGIDPPVERLSEPHPQRVHCAQYGESDWAFLQRILADEGITSYFEHGRSPAWVLIDRTDLHSPARGEALPYRPPMGHDHNTAAPGIQEARMTAHIDTSRATFRDYDFEHPGHTVEGQSETAADELLPREGNLEDYRYDVGEARTGDEASRRAALMRESARSDCRRFDLVTNVPLTAGWRVTVSEHPRADLNAEMLIVGSTLSAEIHRGVHVQLECIRADRRFVPELRPRPRIMCPQTARVVSERADGAEIDVDSHARVLVKFHWDRRTQGHNTSRRIRVSQGWAGPQYGLVCLPRVDDEVIVEFLDGDPDMPIVVGRVHNTVNPIPLSLPAEDMISIWRSRSTPGGNGYNEILLDDTAGRERVAVRAQYDYRREVLHDSRTTIGADRSMEVGGNTRSTVRGAHDEHIDRNMTLNVGGQRTAEIRHDDETTISGDQRLTVKQKRFVKVLEDVDERYLQKVDITVGGDRSVLVTGVDSGAARTFSRRGRELATLTTADCIVLSVDEGPFLRLRKSPHQVVAEANSVQVTGNDEVIATAGYVLVDSSGGVDLLASEGVTINGGFVNIN